MFSETEAIAHLQARVLSAAAAQTPLRIRGGGSKDFYGQSLQGAVLDMRGFSGVISYEPSELVITARAGTPLAEIETLLAAQGQCLPFEPPHFNDQATLGGMVASGLNGPARGSAGAVRDFVLGVKLLNGKGEVLTFGGQVMKNVAGYDVSRLMAGALGTLGVLLEISLKVLPVAPAQATLVFALNEADALRQLNRWAGLPLPINASCWHEGRLSVRLRGAKAAVAAARATLGGEAFDDPAHTNSFWSSLRDQSHPFFALPDHASLWRLSVPDTAAPFSLGPTLMEWGGGQRWITRPAGDAALIRQAAVTASGHATLFRSDDKTVPVFTPVKPPLDRIHRALKTQFDPAGILNPGRLSADW